jgi:hypothetical protein
MGVCTWNEQTGSSTPVTITLSNASLTIDGVTYTASTNINLPPGSYPYTWTALEGYTGSGSGTLVVGDCTPGNATASVSMGVCTWNERSGSSTPVMITLSNASLTINGVTYNASTSINLPPGSYPYTWTALEGFTGNGSGTLVVGECVPPPVPTAALNCFTLEFSAFKLTVGNSGASGEIGYSTNLNPSIVSLGTIANGGSTQILVPGNATTLNLYPMGTGGWGTAVAVPLSKTALTVCEEDPIDLSSICSYVDLTQPFGWTVINNNAFPIEFTWVYGPESSAAPISLAGGAEYSFTTARHTSSSMKIYVEGFLLTSVEHAVCPEFLSLQLTAFCTGPESSTFGWMATNPNAFAVDAEWRVNGSALVGLLTIPANSFVNFTTPNSEGNIVQLYSGGVMQDDASAVQNCVVTVVPPEPPETVVTSIIPESVDPTPVLIPVTGLADDLSGMAPVGMLSLGLCFFGLGTVLHGISRRRVLES